MLHRLTCDAGRYPRALTLRLGVFVGSSVHKSENPPSVRLFFIIIIVYIFISISFFLVICLNRIDLVS